MDLPLLGMGTWGMGGKYERDPRNIEESIQLLRSGFDMGITLVDVAELYGEGLTEEILGKAMMDRARAEMFVISKVWKDHLRYDDVLKAAEGSLRRLRTPYIDLYLIHWPNPDVPLKETMKAMEVLFERGVVKRVGVSNFSVELMKEAQSYLRKTTLFANQIEYNLAVRLAEQDIIPFCNTEGIHVIAYRPLGRGILTSSTNKTLLLLSAKYNKTPAQIALNWIMKKGITAIPKAGSRVHLTENAEATKWHLLPEDVTLLDASRF